MKTIRLISLLLVAAPPVAAQTLRTLDKGSFTISVNGQRVGREDFTISGSPGTQGMEYLSRATVAFGDNRMNPSLWSDPAGVPTRYQIEVRGTAGTVEKWTGGITRGRVSARINTARGESDREYVVSAGAVLLDDDVFHQYYFLALRKDTTSIAIVIPRRNVQMVLKVSVSGKESVKIGTGTVDARHLVFTESGGVTRDVWVDDAGRVLKVALPARNLVAIRDDPPA